MRLLSLLLVSSAVANPFTFPVTRTTSDYGLPTTTSHSTPPSITGFSMSPTRSSIPIESSLALPRPRITAPPAGGEFFEPLESDAPPNLPIDQDAGASGVKFRQTTYYSCVTWPSTVHCGWHEPILDATVNQARPMYASSVQVLWAAAIAGAVIVLILGT